MGNLKLHMTENKFIYLVRPVMGLIPEVEQPLKKQMFKEKLMWTGTVLFIYLICCQIPLYGTIKQEGGDPMYWLRVILASNKGTLMELGISPIITSSMIMQLLSGTKLIDVNMRSQMDRECFNATTKFFGFIMAVGEALAHGLSGMYGEVDKLGIFNSIAILLQLTLAGIVVQLLDELLQKGYGVGSGISLFIATNICEIILWKSFSPITIKTEQDTEFEGAIIALFHSLLTKSNKVMAIQHAFYRENAPNISSLLATVIVFFVVIYFQGFRIELTLSHRKVRGYKVPFPIKLFYTSNIPIILQTAFTSNLYFFAQVLHRKYKGNYFIAFIGKWADSDAHAQAAPVGGLAYLISPPKNLSKHINTAAAFGGICIGALCIFADFMGAIGSGTGILLAVT